MANGQADMSDVTFAPPTQTAQPAQHDMSDVTFEPPASHPIGDVIGKASDVAGGVATGFVKGAGQTVSGISHILNKIPGVGETLAPSEGVKAFDPMTETHGTAEAVGSGLEGLAEFAAGDEALEGVAKGARLVAMAKKFPAVAHALEMAEKSKVLSKIMTGAGKGAVVGGAQGVVKGAAEGKAAEEGAAGAVGGGAGGALGESASALAGIVAKRFGVGTTAAEDAITGIKPKKRNYKFAENFQTAAPRMDAEEQLTPGKKTVEEWADIAEDARKKLWTDEIQPLVDQHKNVPLDGDAIANSIRAAIPDTMKQYSPAEAKKIEDLANQWTSGGGMGHQAMAVPAHNTFVGNAEAALEHYNALVGKTGYWEKSPSVRADLMKTDGELAGNMATANAIRDELYGKLDAFEKARVQGLPTYPAQGTPAATVPARNIQQLKKEYGALRNVEDEMRGRINVAGGQSNMSFTEGIGLILGIGTGDMRKLVGTFGIPMLARQASLPEKAIARAVQKAARPGEEGIISKAVGGARKVAESAFPPAVGAVGAEKADESLSPRGPEPEVRITFQASDGSYHSVPASQIKAAFAVDPHLKVVNQ